MIRYAEAELAEIERRIDEALGATVTKTGKPRKGGASRGESGRESVPISSARQDFTTTRTAQSFGAKSNLF